MGIVWNVQEDTFVVWTNVPNHPFTRRGILGVVNSVFDPLGFVSPVVLGGRLLQRQILADAPGPIDWDAPIDESFREPWNQWKDSLDGLKDLQVPRCFLPAGTVICLQLHVFADASVKAIGLAMYTRAITNDDEVTVTLMAADSKVGPKLATTMPRMELCAAAEAARVSNDATKETRDFFKEVHYYSDSLSLIHI